MKTLRLIVPGIFSLLLLAAFSCQKIPEYSPVPKLEFKEVEHNFSLENGVKKDSLVIVTRFEDGDGDLGLSEEDKLAPPFNTAEGRINYFIDVFIKQNGVFVPLPVSISYNGSFFRLSPDDRIGPIEGELRYGSVVIRENPIVKTGTILKFRIKVRDRKNNFSELVESGEVQMLFNPSQNKG